MPSRNLEKIYIADTFYHIYNRGANKQNIFNDNDDYAVFLNLLKRYLDNVPKKDNKGREYDWLHDRIELLAFCLMPNHFHMLIYQSDESAMTRLLRGVCTAYSRYFNTKYGRTGPLFQNRYKASMITKDDYLEHITRYIHMNPENYENWEFSSLPYYLKQKQSAWVRPDKIIAIFDGHNYLDFLKDYEENKLFIDELKLSIL